MALDYSKLAATVTALMARFGTPGCRVVRPATSAADADQPWKGTDGPDQVVVASCSVLQGGMSRLQIGGPITTRGTGEAPEDDEHSTVFMAAADGALARAGDYLEVGADRLAITKIAPLRPGGVDLLWQLTVKAF